MATGWSPEQSGSPKGSKTEAAGFLSRWFQVRGFWDPTSMKKGIVQTLMIAQPAIAFGSSWGRYWGSQEFEVYLLGQDRVEGWGVWLSRV